MHGRCLRCEARLRLRSIYKRSNSLRRRKHFGEQTSFNQLQIVVPRKIKSEIPGHGLKLTQLRVNDHTLHAIHDSGHAPGRVGEVATRLRATRTELTHYAAEPVGPVAGPEGFAVTGYALDKDFFGGVGDHLVEGF